MRPPFRAIAAALGAGAALAGCANCKEMKDGGSFFAGLICGGEGTPAPEPDPVLPSACQPRAVMPQFFALIDQSDPSLAGLRSVVADLGSPRCAAPAGLVCSADPEAQAKELPQDQRNRICELRRSLDILLQENGGTNLIEDPKVEKVLLSLLDY